MEEKNNDKKADEKTTAVASAETEIESNSIQDEFKESLLSVLNGEISIEEVIDKYSDAIANGDLPESEITKTFAEVASENEIDADAIADVASELASLSDGPPDSMLDSMFDALGNFGDFIADFIDGLFDKAAEIFDNQELIKEETGSDGFMDFTNEDFIDTPVPDVSTEITNEVDVLLSDFETHGEINPDAAGFDVDANISKTIMEENMPESLEDVNAQTQRNVDNNIDVLQIEEETPEDISQTEVSSEIENTEHFNDGQIANDALLNQNIDVQIEQPQEDMGFQNDDHNQQEISDVDTGLETPETNFDNSDYNDGDNVD